MGNKYDIDSIKHKLEVFDFIDSNTERFIHEYFEDFILHSSDDKIGDRMFKHHLKVISICFQDLDIEGVTAEWFLTQLDFNLNSPEIRYLTLMVFFLLQKEEIKDMRLYNITILERNLFRLSNKQNLIFCLTNKNVKKYRTAGRFTDDFGVLAFVNSPHPNSVIDGSMFRYLYDFFEYIKLLSQNTNKELYYNIYYFERALKLSLNKEKLDEINRYSFLKIVKLHSKYRYPLQYVAHLLFFGIENGYLTGEYFMNLASRKEELLTVPTEKRLTRVLESDDPSSIIIRTKKNNLPMNKKNMKIIYCIGAKSSEIQEVLQSFMGVYQYPLPKCYRNFAASFSDSLGGHIVNEVSDLSDVTFFKQIDYFKEFGSNSLRVVINFYIYLLNNCYPEIFHTSNRIAPCILLRNKLAKELMNNYKIVMHSRYESYPSHNKWIIYYYNLKNSNCSLSTSYTHAIDFNEFEDEEIRNLAKFYYWYHDASALTRKNNLRTFCAFIKYRRYLSTFSIIIKKNHLGENNNFTVGDIIAYKRSLDEQRIAPDTKASKHRQLRMVLLFLENHNKIVLDSGAISHLRIIRYKKAENNSIPDMDLQKLTTLVIKKSYERTMGLLFCSIYYLQLVTEFRVSQIITLDYDCIRDAYKSGQYVVSTITKMSTSDPIEQPITLYTKRLLDHVVAATNDCRAKCKIDEINNSLYIYYSERNRQYRRIDLRQFSRFLWDCCDELDIGPYSSTNLRHTYMTKAIEFSIRKSLSELQLPTLTGHKSMNTTFQHYYYADLKLMLESIHGVVIGDVKIEGGISRIKPDTLNISDSVSFSCGYCSSEVCSITTLLDCLMCKDFVTFIDRIPYFEEQIQQIDYKIQNETILHEIEDLNSIKKLLVAYLLKLNMLDQEEVK